MKTAIETVKVEMEIPKDVLFAARIDEEKASLELKRQLALYLFEKEVLSFGKSSELAEMSQWDFMDLLGNKGRYFRPLCPNISENVGLSPFLERMA